MGHFLFSQEVNHASSLSSFMSSIAALKAAITNAEKVQSLFLIKFSTSKMISLGKRMVLLVVGGVDGILNVDITYPRNTFVIF